MKRSTLFALGAVATLGLAAVAVPVIAQQGMRGGHEGMMGGGMMGGMMGPNSYAMQNFDTNKDGTLDAAEIAAGIAADLKTFDADGNGTLSLDEFAAMHAAHTRNMTVRAFQMHDADGDAQVTADEMAATAEMMQQQMAEHMGQGNMMGQGGHHGQGNMMGQGGNN
ncbi:MAG: EF-hand domain-containing protein [Pseudorhodobacter sp.]|nr:EF-hand domain-containing protein [Pseudorhodobacter sp.]